MRWANFLHIYQPPHWPAAIINRVARESYRPLVRFLLRHRDVRLTLNVSGSLTEQLLGNGHRDVLHGIRALAQRGQVELTDSAMYHAILPLLPDSELERQIALNRAVNRRAFGSAFRPRGFFPPELAYSPRLGRLLAQHGYRWVLLAGISHGGIVDHTLRYRIRGLPLRAVFRNGYVSNYLAFQSQLTEVTRFRAIVERWNSQTEALVTAMDGENLGHHRRVARPVWQRLVQQPGIRTVTVSELLTALDREEVVQPRAASWSSQLPELRRGIPFSLWQQPANELHRLQWELFRRVQSLLERTERRGHVPAGLRREFDRSVSSDWYWWASREPWWDVDIIVAAAERLRTIADQLEPKKSYLERIHQLTARIVATAHRWQDSGVARRHAARFLSHDPSPRYLGGKSVR